MSSSEESPLEEASERAGQSFTREALGLARAYQRAIIPARTRAALAAKRARGERIGTVPYGYRLAEDGLHLVADAREQVILASIRQLHGEGLSQRAIVAHLAGRGVVGRRGSPLQQTQVARILRSA
jgi:DNA invertase Pin-like site-specific DNA recombinase